MRMSEGPGGVVQLSAGHGGPSLVRGPEGKSELLLHVLRISPPKGERGVVLSSWGLLPSGVPALFRNDDRGKERLTAMITGG